MKYPRSVLFLDADGVMNNQAWIARGFRDSFDPSAVAWVNSITHATGAGIVFSSVWRKRFHTNADLREFMIKSGITALILGKTPDTGKTRGDDITAFYEKNPRLRELPLAILDDSSDMGPWMPFLVQTTPERGVTHEDALAVVSMLVRQEKEKMIPETTTQVLLADGRPIDVPLFPKVNLAKAREVVERQAIESYGSQDRFQMVTIERGDLCAVVATSLTGRDCVTTNIQGWWRYFP